MISSSLSMSIDGVNILIESKSQHNFEKMGRLFKKINRASNSNEFYMLFAKLEEMVIEGKSYIPKDLEGKHEAGFQNGMDELIKTIKFGKKVSKIDNKNATKLVVQKILAIKEKYHNKYSIED